MGRKTPFFRFKTLFFKTVIDALLESEQIIKFIFKPQPNYPRVIWLGLEDKFDYLFRLQKGINDCLEKKGFEPEERGFTPHLTIGRIKSLKRKNQLIRGIYLYKDINVGEILVAKINLMRSQLNPGGSIYNTLEEVKLRRS